jgi:DNA-binding MarR family transcriptional regulator
MKKDELMRAIGEAVMLWQDATQAYDDEVGRRFGLNAAERHCIAVLAAKGPQSASAVARHVRLTPAAVTALLDRLEGRGYLRRRPDPDDRRRILVEAAEATETVTRDAYQPIAEAGARLLDRFSREELETVLRFVLGAEELQRRFAEEIVSAAPDPAGTRPSEVSRQAAPAPPRAPRR